MMNCKNIRKLLLTDYVDNETSDLMRKTIENHLLDCQNCREFASSTKKAVFDSFSEVERFSPPAELWHKIKEKIEQDPKEKMFFNNIYFFKNIRNIFILSRFAVVLASILIIVSLVLFIKNSNQNVALESQEKENIIYLVSLDQEISSDSDSGSLGTSIEEYFL
ncbi:MAG: zf-HC2 domain-containing protein [Candidatus Omnitrophica bacterium]|nr:zf-HC2 domain-containing protein [Candidatus Omnitrophota bacterium]